jgi:hypothetical protein
MQTTVIGPGEEVFLPYPENRVATRFRSTWLSSSLKAMRTRGLLDQYLENLPRQHHAAVLDAVAGVWLPVEVAVAHYDAMDRLKLPESEIVKIGLEVTERFHSAFFSTVFRLAQGVGATPWSVFRHCQRMWDKTWVGGGIAIWKLGPREARCEIVGWPCARFDYCRIGMRGVTLGTVNLFCRSATVYEVTKSCTNNTLGYRMRWT